jgi:hypothetical protein
VASINSKIDKAMTTEQFTQVVDAILEGKYSWACVLILRFAGYNPLHYIPYRTYNRLMKENSQKHKRDCCKVNLESQQPERDSEKVDCKIQDLNYLETLDQKALIKGGNLPLSQFQPESYFEISDLNYHFRN